MEKKIKSVLIVTSAEFTPDQGGPGRFIGELYKSLLNRDIKYFQSYSFNLPNNLDTFEDNLRIAKPRFWIKFFRDVIYFIPVIGQFSYLAKLYFVSKKLATNSKKYNLINCHDYISAFAFIMHGYKNIVLTTHSKGSNYNESVKFKRKNYSRYDWKLLFTFIEKQSILRSRFITFPSNGAKHLLISDYPYLDETINQKSKIIYTGLKKINIKPNQNKSNPYILSIANHIPAKGLDIIVKAFANLRKEFPSISLINCGAEGPETKKIKSLIDDFSLDNHIQFKGIIPLNEVYDLIANSKAIVMGSTSTVFDLVILEAMSIGIPIIATDIEGFREALGKNYQFLANPNDHDDLSEKIKGLLNMVDADLHIGRELQSRFINKFELSKMGESYEKFYKRIINSYNNS